MALLGLSREEPLRPSAVSFELRRPTRSTSLGAVRQLAGSSSLQRTSLDHSPYRRLEGDLHTRARSSAGLRESCGVSRSYGWPGRDEIPAREVVTEPTTFAASLPLSPAVPSSPSALRAGGTVVPAELEARAQRRQRNWGTLSSSWLVKNCFSAWRSFVQAQLAAARAQMQQELQLSAVLELQTSLLKKEQEIKRLIAEMQHNEWNGLNRFTMLQNTAADASLRYRVFSAWRLAKHRSLAELLQRFKAELRDVQTSLRVTNEELAALQLGLMKARETRRQALDQRMRDEQMLKARVLDLWHRMVSARYRELALENQESLRDMEHQMRRSENEWRLKYQQLEEKLKKSKEAAQDGQMRAMMALMGKTGKGLLSCAFVEWMRYTSKERAIRLEEEGRDRDRKLQLQLEDLRRRQLEVRQGSQMRAMVALLGRGAKGLLSCGFVAWMRYTSQMKGEKAGQHLELTLSKKDQEIQKMLKDYHALQRSLKDLQSDFLRARKRTREEAFYRANLLLGGGRLSYQEALRLSQVLAAWLLVAMALHWARAKELQAGQADQLRLQLDELRRENRMNLRNRLLSSWETRDVQALLSRVLHAWHRCLLHGSLEAEGERSSAMAHGWRSRQDLLLERACLALGSKNARQLLRACFRGWMHRLESSRLLHGSRSMYQSKLESVAAKMFARYMEATPIAIFLAWSRAARQQRFERAAQQLLSKVDFLRRSKVASRESLMSRSLEQNALSLIRKVLAAWWQDARAEKMRKQWNRALNHMGDRGVTCGTRLAAKYWSMKMRLLLFASFMAWRFRLARESSQQLKKALAETEAAHFAFQSRGLMLADAFRRWRRWAADLAFQRSVSALLSRTTGPGRVLAVVSSIEEKRQRLLCMEAFLRWRMVLRWKSQSPVTTSPRGQVLRPAYTVMASPVIRTSSASAVRAAACPSCSNAYLPEDIFCRLCGRKRDLVSLDINRPTVTLPMQPCRQVVTTVIPPVAPVTPTSVVSIHPEDVLSTPRSPASQLPSPEVRTEYRTEPVAVVGSPVMEAGTPRPVVTPDHSPVRFIPRLNSGWPPSKEGRNQREGASLLRSGSDTSLGPTVWRAR